MKLLLVLLTVFPLIQDASKYRATEFSWRKPSIETKFHDKEKVDFLVVFKKKRISIYSPKKQEMDIISEGKERINSDDETIRMIDLEAIDSDGQKCDVLVTKKYGEVVGIFIKYDSTDVEYAFFIEPVD